MLGVVPAALAASVLLGVYLWGSLPGYFASFAFYPVAEAFGTRELIRGLVCVLAMLPVRLGYSMSSIAIVLLVPLPVLRGTGYFVAAYRGESRHGRRFAGAPCP